MEPGKGRFAARRVADDQRHMFGSAIKGAERHDFGCLGPIQREFGASGNAESRRCRITKHVSSGDRQKIAAGRGDENRRQQSGEFCQTDGGVGCVGASTRDGLIWPLQRGGQVPNRVRCSKRFGHVHPSGPLDTYGTGTRRRALINDVQRGCPGMAQKQVGPSAGFQVGEACIVGEFNSENRLRADPDGSTTFQLVNCTGNLDGGVQVSNSAMIGTWSDGLSQLRADSTTRNPVTLSAMSGLVQIWSSRRPLSDAFQSAAR